MDSASWDIYEVIDIFLLLFIGIGPKIALVPFVELTQGMDAETKARVTRKMLVTAGTVAVVLLVLGEFLRRLLHFSTGALSVASGIILVIIAVRMVLGQTSEEPEQQEVDERDPMEIAVFPVAVP
jgi:small neutral amino acid transporter SnatA (MarC family)